VARRIVSVWFSRSELRALGLAGLVLVIAATSRAEEPPGDDELRMRIEARLVELQGSADADIDVAVRDGQVLLRGRVHLLEESLRAEQTAWTTPGVLDVENEIRVVPRVSPMDAEIERQVREVIKSDARFADTNLRLEVTAGFVRFRGLFQDPADVLAFKHRVAAIPGVLAVEIEAVLVARRDGTAPRRFAIYEA
jgi:osmotically-inducible protein OsmY